MAVDLHTHSRYSDGSESPAEIVAAAGAIGLSAVALTDHDILDGVEEARQAAAGLEVDFVPGTELSVEWRGKGMHLLVYWIDADSPLALELETIQRYRVDRNREMVDALNGLGIDITIEELKTEAGQGVIGRPHFAAILVRKGAVATIQDAFDRYLAAGKPAYRPRIRVEAGHAMDLARESGATPVIAHPHTLADDMEEFGHLFHTFRDLGAVGVECYYVEYPPALRDRMAKAVTDIGLVPSGGSDYHGSYKPGIALGSGKGDLVVPDSCLDQLRERRMDP